MNLVDTVPVVSYWSEVKCCTILTIMSDLEVMVMDFKILLKFLVLVFRTVYLLNMWKNVVDTVPVVRYWSEVQNFVKVFGFSF